MALSKEHLKDVCRLGGGAHTCSYLVMGTAGFECSKGTGMETMIRERREAGTMNAGGDNCSGAPDFEPSEAPLVTH